jgi:hypothetical protein
MFFYSTTKIQHFFNIIKKTSVKYVDDLYIIVKKNIILVYNREIVIHYFSQFANYEHLHKKSRQPFGRLPYRSITTFSCY